MIEKTANTDPSKIVLNIKDTGFILSLFNRTQIMGNEFKQAQVTINKFESLHIHLSEKEQLIQGI
tara:strand:- start:2856 stop:3050 length:195 start_codon:yes stop_codon:yes gene_type:complete